jgi:hypothetical protein
VINTAMANKAKPIVGKLDSHSGILFFMIV